MKILLVIVSLLLISTAQAETKTLTFNAGKTVSYDVPIEWEQSIKQVPKPSEIQMIRLKKDANSQIQIMFLSVKPESPLAKERTPDKAIALMHAEACQQYVAASIEGDQPAKKVTSKEFIGYESTFTDKRYVEGQVPSGDFRNVSRLTYVVGPPNSGVIALIVLLSQDLNAPDYQTMKTITESLRFSSGG
ncbi:MAG: hypothetical protein ACO1N8_13410 [Methylophilus sp.]